MNSQSNPLPLFTVKQFAERYPAWTESGLRWLIFNAHERTTKRGLLPANGLAPAIVRQGRKVLIHEEKFLSWLGQHTL